MASNTTKKILKRSHTNFPFFSESKQNIVQAVDFFINHGADINAETSQGQTALTYTSRDGFIETVKKLVENGADVNATTSFGVTALMVSCKKGNKCTFHFKISRTVKQFLLGL